MKQKSQHTLKKSGHRLTGRAGWTIGGVMVTLALAFCIAVNVTGGTLSVGYGGTNGAYGQTTADSSQVKAQNPSVYGTAIQSAQTANLGQSGPSAQDGTENASAEAPTVTVSPFSSFSQSLLASG